ncbi:MAG: ABC transporter ATP-binding protein [Microbacterium sp.]
MTAAPRAVVEVEDLSIDYHRRGHPTMRAVSSASLTVGEQEIVGIVGESGSGKTSLAMCVAGLVEPTEGIVAVRGQHDAARGRRARLDRRADVQVVFQNPYEALDARQRLDRGLKELRSIHPQRTAWTTDAELFDLVGLSDVLLTRYPHEISGGQAQRVAIARALLLRPVVLVADEPTSALDVSVQARLLKLLGHLRDSQSLSILFISHDLGVVRQLCDRVYVMERSKIVESGSAQDVFDSPQHPYTDRLLSFVPGRTGNVVGEEVAGASVDVVGVEARQTA